MAWGSFQGEGKAFLDGIETGTLESLTSQLSFSSININPANSTATHWQGNNDKTSLEKDVITIVHLTFEL